MKGRPDETEDLIQMYVPMAQDLMDDTFLLVRPASAGFEGLAPAVCAAIARVDTEQLASIRSVLTLETLGAREALPALRGLLQDSRRSNLGDRTTVAEAARRAIAVISQLR